tara:strand:- start:333 stop:857 length:525 start_codon:yes stop_codon:yes gene_type:complete
MFIAQEKKKNNILEYILYMWQVENIIRACQFDIKLIQSNVIAQLGLTDNDKDLVKEWYLDLIQQMKSQNLQQEGHLSFTRDIITELTLLHQTLLKTFKDKSYNPLYNNARGDIYDLQKKQPNDPTEIEACINGMFGLWMLKVSQKEVSQETQKSFNRITKLLARLGKNYHEMMA